MGKNECALTAARRSASDGRLRTWRISPRAVQLSPLRMSHKSPSSSPPSSSNVRWPRSRYAQWQVREPHSPRCRTRTTQPPLHHGKRPRYIITRGRAMPFLLNALFDKCAAGPSDFLVPCVMRYQAAIRRQSSAQSARCSLHRNDNSFDSQPSCK
jgi:hypothetical protein